MTYAIHLALALCLSGMPTPGEATGLERELEAIPRVDSPSASGPCGHDDDFVAGINELEESDEYERRDVAAAKRDSLPRAAERERAEAPPSLPRSHPDQVHAHAPRGPPTA